MKNSVSNYFEDKVILISGAAGAMGQTGAMKMFDQHAKIGIMDLTKNVENVASNIKNLGGEVISFTGDICKETDVHSFVSFVIKEFGKIDGVMNIAAVYKGLVNRDFEEIPAPEWDKVLNVNITGTWMLTKEVVPYMKRQKSGSIVNISSATVFFGAPGMLHYVASKAAVLGMTKAMAQELGPHGIRVNCIAPGLLPTESSLERISDVYVEKIKSSSALRKLADTDDIINVASFLLSDNSKSITGQTIVVDGGRIFL
jgi:NAD(P)-dependent dehydrogenase (short-subunit alcohol dehydrogenase family)